MDRPHAPDPADGGMGPGGDHDGRGAPGAGPAAGPGPLLRRPHPAVLVVVVAALVEAAALAVASVWGLVQVLTATEPRVGVAVFLLLFLAGVAVVLAASARALHQGRRSGRAPVATWQLLQGATALALAQVLHPLLPVVVVGLSLTVFVLLLTRPVVEHTVPLGSRTAGPAGSAGPVG